MATKTTPILRPHSHVSLGKPQQQDPNTALEIKSGYHKNNTGNIHLVIQKIAFLYSTCFPEKRMTLSQFVGQLGLMLQQLMCTSPLLQMLSAWGLGLSSDQQSSAWGGMDSVFQNRCYQPLCVCHLGFNLVSEGNQSMQKARAQGCCVHGHPSCLHLSGDNPHLQPSPPSPSLPTTTTTNIPNSLPHPSSFSQIHTHVHVQTNQTAPTL